jgi:hypothetical protein
MGGVEREVLTDNFREIRPSAGPVTAPMYWNAECSVCPVLMLATAVEPPYAPAMLACDCIANVEIDVQTTQTRPSRHD